MHFKIDYKNSSGEIKDYYPDFLVKVSEREIYIVETKGREDLDDLAKKKRLQQWCADVNRVQTKVKYGAIYVLEDKYKEYRPRNFAEVIKIFELPSL